MSTKENGLLPKDLIERFQPTPFLAGLDKAEALAEEYQIPTEDILCISLNCSGVNQIEKGSDRVRFVFESDISNRRYRLALTSSDTPLSPFTYQNREVSLDGERIGKTGPIEKDTCTDSYWRRKHKHLTLNSNSRSNCHGCEFCGTYTLDEDDQPLNTSSALKDKVSQLMQETETDLSELESIGIVTGCFPSEERVVEHLSLVRGAFANVGFTGEVQYIGSQVRSDEALQKLASEGPFAYYLTVESFDRREQLMKKTKASLDLETGRQLLAKAKSYGIESTFLYISGLDSLERFEAEIKKYSEVITRLPFFQTFQVYHPSQIVLRNPQATKPDYYLKMRQIVETTFPLLRPDLSLNYRGLWYSKYANEALPQAEL